MLFRSHSHRMSHHPLRSSGHRSTPADRPCSQRDLPDRRHPTTRWTSSPGASMPRRAHLWWVERVAMTCWSRRGSVTWHSGGVPRGWPSIRSSAFWHCRSYSGAYRGLMAGSEERAPLSDEEPAVDIMAELMASRPLHPALGRLHDRLVGASSQREITSYDRMHHRHNRK